MSVKFYRFQSFTVVFLRYPSSICDTLIVSVKLLESVNNNLQCISFAFNF